MWLDSPTVSIGVFPMKVELSSIPSDLSWSWSPVSFSISSVYRNTTSAFSINNMFTKKVVVQQGSLEMNETMNLYFYWNVGSSLLSF